MTTPSRPFTSSIFDIIFFIQPVLRRDGDDRHLCINQCNRTVFHLSSRVSFRMNIGNFFELEGSFQSYRVIHAATEEEKIAAVVELFRNKANIIGISQEN